MAIQKQVTSKTSFPAKKVLNYGEVVEYLNAHWHINTMNKTLARIKELDAALGNPSKKVPALLIAGTNGKSVTIGLAAKLLKEEGIKVGTFMSPHLLTYNERLMTNLEAIANQQFAEIGSEVIHVAESKNIQANTHELLTMMALLYFVESEVDVALLEVADGGSHDATNICTALVASITRVTHPDILVHEDERIARVNDIMGIIKKGTWLVSGDQNKANLEQMEALTEKQGGQWAMPIRKLAPLSYPYEQLHGRCAALAERIAHMYIEHFYNKNVTVTADSLLSRKKSKRGRPTLEEKRKSELKPRKTVEQFWKEEFNELPGRFQILKKEHPVVLLDTASNLDAFENTLLGIRLLQYKQPLKGLVIIMAASIGTMYGDEFLKLLRYFFKKTSGQILICPIESPIPGVLEESSWNVEKVTNDIKSMKVKARACKSFHEAFEIAQQTVDEREGLICITGSHSIVSTYFASKGIKKF